MPVGRGLACGATQAAAAIVATLLLNSCTPANTSGSIPPEPSNARATSARSTPSARVEPKPPNRTPSLREDPPRQALAAFAVACRNQKNLVTVGWDTRLRRYVRLKDDIEPIPSRDGARAATRSPIVGTAPWPDVLYGKNIRADPQQDLYLTPNWQWSRDGRMLVNLKGGFTEDEPPVLAIKDVSTGKLERIELEGPKFVEGNEHWRLLDRGLIVVHTTDANKKPKESQIWYFLVDGTPLKSFNVPGLPVHPLHTVENYAISYDGSKVLLYDPALWAGQRSRERLRYLVYDLDSMRVIGKVPLPHGWVGSDHLWRIHNWRMEVWNVQGRLVRSTPLSLPSKLIGCQTSAIAWPRLVPATAFPGAFSF